MPARDKSCCVTLGVSVNIIFMRVDDAGGKLEFRDIQRLAEAVRSTTEVQPRIPNGRKDNVMFVTQLRLDEHTGRATYADDCGAWKAKSSTTKLNCRQFCRQI